MRDVSCKLITTESKQDNIGVPLPDKITEREIPIIKVEDIYANEYYEANQSGYKPSLSLRISALNYNNEQELKYMNTVYTIIRVQEVTADEIVLICERKIKNV